MAEQEIDLGIGSLPLVELDKGIQLPTVSEVIDGSAFGSDLAPLVSGGDSAQLQICLADFGLVAMTAEEFITAGVDALNKSLVQACKAGVAFWAAQESLKTTTPPGGVENFKEWIDKAGLPQQRVYECIRLAKYYARLPENQRGKMLAIGKKQALLLAKMPQEVIDRVAENGTDILDEAETMTYDQLRDLLKTVERRNQQLNAEIEHRDALIGKLKKREPLREFHPQTQAVREECLVRQAEIELACENIWAMFEEVSREDVNSPEWRIRLEAVWMVAHVAAARAANLMNKVQEYAPVENLPDTINTFHCLRDHEADRWLLDWQMLERKDAAAKALREQKREDAKPKGPGRPKKGQ